MKKEDIDLSGFRPVVGYEGLYLISESGKVWSVPRTVARSNGIPMTIKGRLLKAVIGHNGYWTINLTTHALGSKRNVLHRVLALAWVPGYKKGLHVNHKNGIKTDNRLENLEWVTPSENIKHAYQTGLNKRSRKFTDHQIENIRARIRVGECVRTIAVFFNVSEAAITKIKLGQTYVKTTAELSKATAANPVF